MNLAQTIPLNDWKAYRNIPIRECGEPLLPISRERFAFFNPPPYISFGANYEGASPWMLRQGVLAALNEAQSQLAAERPGWKIMFFDAYRPNKVQVFMVEREFDIKAREAGFELSSLTPEQHQALAQKVFKYWAIPSEDPLTPPPHSTGAAMDITLANEKGEEVDMGSLIDEGAPPASPDFFADATDARGKQAHSNRLLLRRIMHSVGFHQHCNEWWHFSKGDQLWAWTESLKKPGYVIEAIYGRADLI